MSNKMATMVHFIVILMVIPTIFAPHIDIGINKAFQGCYDNHEVSGLIHSD